MSEAVVARLLASPGFQRLLQVFVSVITAAERECGKPVEKMNIQVYEEDGAIYLEMECVVVRIEMVRAG